LQRERSLQQQLDTLEKQRIEVLNRPNHTPAQEAELEKQRQTLIAQYQDIQTQIRTTSPRYAALTQPQPLTREQIQQQILDENTILLQYSLGKERSYLWAVTKTSIISYELPKAAEIETTADFAASRATATSQNLSQYKIIHFATHGFANSDRPELSGIVMSLVDEKGNPLNGFLRLTDIFNLKLAADLVVLSACQTGMGQNIQGEGLVGLTRGFMYAGAQRVVVSLWTVDDEGAATLMSSFYQGMLQKGLTPAAALRAAQLEMWKQEKWKSPYYWAAFTLQGEWR
jgi:hypothetical protein